MGEKATKAKKIALSGRSLPKRKTKNSVGEERASGHIAA